MKATFVLKNLSAEFLATKETEGASTFFAWLSKQAYGGDLKHCVSIKIGTGQFRDRVELNQILRGTPSIDYVIEPRKGYKLATFNIA